VCVLDQLVKIYIIALAATEHDIFIVGYFVNSPRLLKRSDAVRNWSIEWFLDNRFVCFKFEIMSYAIYIKSCFTFINRGEIF